MKRKLVLYIFLIMSLFCSPQAQAITRGEALDRIIKTLELPVWKGKSFADVPKGHIYSQSIDSAFSMGILFPSDRFYPDMEATRLEALAFSFKAMGWSHEAEIVKKFFAIDKSLPIYLSPYHYLARESSPQAPISFIDRSTENLSEKDMKSLEKWLKACLTDGISWRGPLTEGTREIIFNREGVGKPGKGWNIVLGEFDSEKEANQKKGVLAKKGIKTYIGRSDCAFELRIGPFKNHAVAWMKSVSLPSPYRSSPVISHGRGSGRPLFWIAIGDSPSNFKIAPAPGLGSYKLPLSDIVKRSKSSGGINGGFFYGKNPIGTMIIGDIPVNRSHKDRSAIGWNEKNQVFFGNGNYKVYINTENGEVPVSAINEKTGDEKVGLYTPHFGQFALSARGTGTEFTVKSGRIMKKMDSMKSNHFMKLDEIIVKANTSGLGPLEGANKANLEINWKDSRMRGASQVIQAGPMLYGSGRKFSCEGFSRSIVEKRHPRTMVCWRGNKLYWIVIDGRSSWHSAGATLSEAAFIAKQMGMEKALNLDGGGSSEIIWRDIILNSPSGGVERPLPYGIIF